MTNSVSVDFVCPRCRTTLVWASDGLACTTCGRRYRMERETPVLVGEYSAGSEAQAEWFDQEVDAEFEIERPNGVPRLHRWLLEQKFARNVAGLDLRGATALAVCGGSGMDAEFLARAGAQVVTADISLAAAGRATERARRHGVALSPIVADVHRLPFADSSVDVVYVHDGLHHVDEPLAALAEMARVARRAVCVTEPADAVVTAAAVKVGLALEREEAGNRVARLRLADVRATLEGAGYRVLRAQRYAMFYRHEPGIAVSVLSRPGLFSLATFGLRGLNGAFGRFGNKLVVTAVRP